MKMMALLIMGVLAAFGSFLCGLRGMTISIKENDGLQRKKFWFFMQRALLTAFFAFMAGTASAPGGDWPKTLQFYLSLVVAVIGFAGMMIEYAAALRGQTWGLKAYKDAIRGSQSKSESGSEGLASPEVK